MATRLVESLLAEVGAGLIKLDADRRSVMATVSQVQRALLNGSPEPPRLVAEAQRLRLLALETALDVQKLALHLEALTTEARALPQVPV